MRFLFASLVFFLLSSLWAQQSAVMTGYRDAAAQSQIEKQFLAVPDPARAEQHLKTLTAEPHMAGTPEDKKTADYVAAQFRAAGLQAEIVEYKVWMNYPAEIVVDIVAPKSARAHLSNPERVSSDPFQSDPRIVMPFNGSSPSGDAEAEVIYANFGRPEDLKALEDMKIDVRGKILLIRYGETY